MATTFEKCTAGDMELIYAVMAQYHAELKELGATVQALLATAQPGRDGEPGGPALKHRGQAAYALIRTTKLSERVLGMADLEIQIDAEYWSEAGEETRRALIDHELSHRIPRLDKDGSPKRDDLDRPLFAGVDHDFEVGWFFSIPRRHSSKSVEYQQLLSLFADDAFHEAFGDGTAIIAKARERRLRLGMERYACKTATNGLPNDFQEGST
jgi:hypothetical protein